MRSAGCISKNIPPRAGDCRNSSVPPTHLAVIGKDAGFNGIEWNHDFDNDLSPKHGTQADKAIRKMADEIGIQISGLCSFHFWPYPLGKDRAGGA